MMTMSAESLEAQINQYVKEKLHRSANAPGSVIAEHVIKNHLAAGSYYLGMFSVLNKT